MKDYIDDEQFERLNWHEQKYYRWCTKCNQYYHEDSNHTCNNERILYQLTKER